MNKQLVLISVLATSSAFAANFGGGTPAASTTTTSAPAAPATVLPAVSGPQAGPLFRVVKPDGATVIQQGNLLSSVLGTSAQDVLTVSEADALVRANGRCAFNVKYDEVSASPATNTTNRLFSNDAAIAVNSAISLTPGMVKTIWTQPYLFSGMNNIRVVVNADSPTPSTKWVRVNVLGTCGAKPGTTPVQQPAATPTPTTGAAPVTTAPTPPKTTPVVVTFKPGSAEWNNLNVVWGYSNYATTQLKNKGYARYGELSQLNAAVTAVVQAGVVEQAKYNSLMTTWNTFVTEPAFKAAMQAITPPVPGQK